jgi:hypothetical protein
MVILRNHAFILHPSAFILALSSLPFDDDGDALTAADAGG